MLLFFKALLPGVAVHIGLSFVGIPAWLVTTATIVTTLAVFSYLLWRIALPQAPQRSLVVCPQLADPMAVCSLERTSIEAEEEGGGRSQKSDGLDDDGAVANEDQREDTGSDRDSKNLKVAPRTSDEDSFAACGGRISLHAIG